MKRLTLIPLLALLTIPHEMYGQAPGSNNSTILFQTDPPAPVNSVSATVVGNGGSRQFFYWIVAKYPVGNSIPYGPAQVVGVANTLTGTNYVRVNWAPVSGASTYDVIRTTTPTLPNGTANLLIANTATTQVLNQAETINAYTITGTQTSSASIGLNNRDYALPALLMSTYPITPSYVKTGVPTQNCLVGQIYFRTDAAAGANLYLCTATPNTWTNVSGGGGGTVSVVGSGNLVSTAFASGGGAQTVQTPCATCTLDASGNAAFTGTVSGQVIAATGANPGELEVLTTGGANTMSWLAPTTRATNIRFEFPDADSTVGQVMAFTAPDAGTKIAKGSWVTPGGASVTKVPITVPLFSVASASGGTFPSSSCSLSSGALAFLPGDFGGGIIKFPDASTPTAECTIPVPKGWDGGTVELAFPYYTNSGSGDVKVTVDSHCIPNGGTTPSYTDPSSMVIVGVTQATQQQGSISALTLNGSCAALRMLSLRIARPTADAADTYSSDFNIYSSASITFLVNLQ